MMSQMNNTSALIADFDQALKTALQDSPAWLKAIRQDAAQRFLNDRIPTTKDEDWKYTNLDALTRGSFAFAEPSRALSLEAIESYAQGDTVLVFVNGVYHAPLSKISKQLSANIVILPLTQAVEKDERGAKEMFTTFETSGESVFEALNQALWRDGVYIKVAPKTSAGSGLIHLLNVVTAQARDVYASPRCLIHVGSLSDLTVMESHISLESSDKIFINGVLDVRLEEGATLNHCLAQRLGAESVQITNTRVWCERNARFNGFTFTTQTGLTRNGLNAVLNAEGSDATLKALYSIYGQQHVDNHTCVHHRAPNCTSNQLYKGILNGDSRAVFNGRIVVDPAAQQTNSYQLNKTLMLGKNARIDTKPQLEIFADDVKCTHGATIGHLDETQMFYLQSRCISKAQATKILARGFADDVLNQIDHTEIKDKLHGLLESSMQMIGA